MPSRLLNPEENREHPSLLVLYLLSFGTPLLMWTHGPALAQVGGWVGAISLALLVLRWALIGFTGYERTIGLRIIRRLPPQNPARALAPIWKRGRFWLLVFWSTAALGIAALLAFNHYVDPNDEALAELLQPLRVCLVFYVAATTFAGLLLAVARRFTVFGTTSILGLTLGLSALLVIQSVSSGFQHDFEDRVVGVYAHINVTRGTGIAEHRRFEAWLRTLDGVEGASPFVYYPMALAPQRPGQDTDLRLASVMVKGIEPTTAGQVIELPQQLERGSGRAIPLTDLRSDYPLMPVPDRTDEALPEVIAQTPDPRGADWYDEAIRTWSAREHDQRVGLGYRPIVVHDVWEDPPEDLDAAALADELDRSALPTMFIGVGLARELDLAEGDVVRLVDPGSAFDHTERPKFVHFAIAGLFQAGFQEYDSRLVYVDIKELQRFRYAGKDIVSGVDLRLADRERAPELGATIRAALNGPDDDGEYAVLEWQKLNEKLFASIRSSSYVITVVLSLVMFVASFNVLSSLWNMVVRRTSDIAILMSMGATGPQVARIFQVTGMTIGLVGSLAGVLFGLVMCWLVKIYGYTLDTEVYLIEHLPVEIDLVRTAWLLVIALAICFVATIPPALRAARLRPVDGLKFD